MPYLTPEEIPESTQCGTLLIPDDAQIIAAVIGALYDLTLPENWELFGAVTPDEMAAAMQVMFDQFMEDCPMSVSFPVGAIIAYTGESNTPPDGWHRCTGTVLLRADYPDLFDVIGTTYSSVGIGEDEFQLPDLRGRGLQGAGYEGGTGGYTFTMAERLGHKAHTLSINEIPAHTHTQKTGTSAGSNLGNARALFINPNAEATQSVTSSVGGGLPFDTMPPVVVVTWLIRILP